MNGSYDVEPVAVRGSRGWRIGLVFASVWLLFLIGPMIDLWSKGNPLALELLGTVLAAGFVALYLWQVAAPFHPARRPRRWAPLAALGISLAMLPLTGSSGLSFLVFVGVMCQALWPIRWAVAGALGLAALTVGLGEAVPGWTDVGIGDALSILAASMAMFGVVRMAERNTALVVAQGERAELAVAQERERFATDLHDILGHSLTVVTVKAQLAQRLVDSDTARARAEIADIERLAREALQDVRSTVGGYRTMTLAGELVAARTALEAAGIDADLPNAVDEIPGELRELFGRVVREAVTNVVRHSGATRCRVEVDPTSVTVSDDGRGRVGGADGAGLVGLCARVAEAGGQLRTDELRPHGFSLRASFVPAADPGAAAVRTPLVPVRTVPEPT